MLSSTLNLTPDQAAMVDEYLRTGHHGEVLYAPWPGDMMERAKAATQALRGALVNEVRRREGKVVLPSSPPPEELQRMTRSRVEAMVRGLFPAREQDVVLALLEKSVVFITPGDIEQVLHGESFGHSAWTLANLYLASIDADLLTEDAPDILGLSQATTCLVTAKYLEGRGKFDDYIVHEAAHVFHNWKRRYAGLPHTRHKEWLLPIEFGKREPFAFACEVYSRIVEQGSTRKAREALLEEYARKPFCIERLDTDEHLDILCEAVSSRNGWKRILARCSHPLRGRRAVGCLLGASTAGPQSLLVSVESSGRHGSEPPT
jgi:hypothetical protein